MSETLLILIASLLVPLIVWALNLKLNVRQLPALLVTMIVVAILAAAIHWLGPAHGFAAFIFDFLLTWAGSNLVYQVAHYINRARGLSAPPRST